MKDEIHNEEQKVVGIFFGYFLLNALIIYPFRESFTITGSVKYIIKLDKYKKERWYTFMAGGFGIIAMPVTYGCSHL